GLQVARRLPGAAGWPAGPEAPITLQVLHGQGAWLRSSRMPTLDERGDHEGGLIALVRETASGFGQLVADHIRLARLEMTADAKSYVRDGGVLLVGGFILAIGYAMACIAAGLALSRVIGGPMAFGGLALLHLIVGAI